MGASDPAWSPDGRQVAFSLFGRIWRMPADGGDAEQITTGKWYDAGAAWAPDGKSIAVVRGAISIAIALITIFGGGTGEK